MAQSQCESLTAGRRDPPFPQPSHSLVAVHQPPVFSKALSKHGGACGSKQASARPPLRFLAPQLVRVGRSEPDRSRARASARCARSPALPSSRARPPLPAARSPAAPCEACTRQQQVSLHALPRARPLLTRPPSQPDPGLVHRLGAVSTRGRPSPAALVREAADQSRQLLTAVLSTPLSQASTQPTPRGLHVHQPARRTSTSRGCRSSSQ